MGLILPELSEKEVWRSNCNGHELSVVNGKKCQLICDGDVIAEQKGLLSTKFVLVGMVDNKKIVAVIDGSFSNQTNGAENLGRIFVCDEIDCEYGYINKEGNFCAITEET